MLVRFAFNRNAKPTLTCWWCCCACCVFRRWMGKIRKQYPVAIVHEDFTPYLMEDLQSRLR